jgi:hypothetical protein
MVQPGTYIIHSAANNSLIMLPGNVNHSRTGGETAHVKDDEIVPVITAREVFKVSSSSLRFVSFVHGESLQWDVIGDSDGLYIIREHDKPELYAHVDVRIVI